MIDALEYAEEYAAFQWRSLPTDLQSAVERELVLRLVSVLWPLRRTTAIERVVQHPGAASAANSINQTAP